jgi:hypothetical protein
MRDLMMYPGYIQIYWDTYGYSTIDKPGYRYNRDIMHEEQI